jgi:hypothetical protein
MKLGELFEKIVIAEFIRHDGVIPYIGTEKDTKEGTDFTFQQVPVDVTCNPEKDNCTKSKEADIRLGNYVVNVRYRFRTANKVVKFNQPVLVLEVTASNSVLAMYMEDIAEEMGRQFNYLMDDAMDFYWTTYDEAYDCA